MKIEVVESAPIAVSIDLVGRALQISVEQTDRNIAWQQRKVERAQRQLERLRVRRSRELDELKAYDRDGTRPKRKKAQKLVEEITRHAERASGIRQPVVTQGAVGAIIPETLNRWKNYEVTRMLDKGKKPAKKGSPS